MKTRTKVVLALFTAFSLVVGKAWADYTVLDSAGVTKTVFAFVCFTTKICPANVLVDSTGTEKGTAANPVQVGGFTSNNAFATVTSGNASSASTALPAAATTVRISNLGTTTGGTTISCTFATGAATGARSNVLITPIGTVYRTVGAFDHIACINQLSGDTTANVALIEGGSGLNTDTIGTPCTAASAQPAYNNGTIALPVCDGSGAKYSHDPSVVAQLQAMVTTQYAQGAALAGANGNLALVNTNNAQQAPHICGTSKFVHITSATDTQIVAASGSTTIYVCDYEISSGGTINLFLEKATTGTCATTTQIGQTWYGAANTGKAAGNAYYRGLNTGSSAQLCANTSGAGVASGIDVTVYYDQY